MQYPHERFMRWLLACGLTPEAIGDACRERRLYVDEGTIREDLEALRRVMAKEGGKVVGKHLAGKGPQRADGSPRPLPKRALAKAVGTPMDLSDQYLMGLMDMILQAAPVRRAVELLSAKGIDAGSLARFLRRRFDMEVEEEVIAFYCALYWDTSAMSFPALYNYLSFFPDTNKDKRLYTICLEQPVHYVQWRLSYDERPRWDEKTFLQKFMANLQQQLLNAVDPSLSMGDSREVVALLACYQNANDLYQESLARDNQDAAREFVSAIHDRVRLKKAEPPPMKVIGDLEHIG